MEQKTGWMWLVPGIRKVQYSACITPDEFEILVQKLYKQDKKVYDRTNRDGCATYRSN